MINSIVWLNLDTPPGALDSLIAKNNGLPRYFRVDTSAAREPESDMMKLSLINREAKKLLIALTNLGYSLYYNISDESRFVRHDRIVHHWPAVRDGTYTVSDEGIIHQLEIPESGNVERLVIIMCPISSKPRFLRYFRPSFAKLMKFVPRNTAVLRVADIGGVKGAFYLNTSYLPENSRRIQRLIQTTINEHSIKSENVVLFGASKGGTGALFHGLVGGWKFVAVDPILSDEWYVDHENDYHFTTGGIFPCTKQEVFTDLIQRIHPGRMSSLDHSVLITSSRSPQYAYTTAIIQPIESRLTVLSSGNPEIMRHPDVAPKTIYSQVLAINNLLLGFSMPKGEYVIP